MSNNTVNKKVRLLFIISVVFCCGLLIACPMNWQKNVTKNGIYFKKLRYNEDLKSYTGFIDTDINTGGYSCQKGWIRFFDNWQLKSFVTTQDLNLSDNYIPAGTWIEFDRSGRIRLCAFPRDTSVRGIVCKGTSGNPKGFHTTFYPDGALKYCCPVTDLEIKGIPCKSGFFEIIGLHPNGNLMECELSRDFVLNDLSLKKGEKIRLNPDRSLDTTIK
jgi:hypothetical protein